MTGTERWLPVVGYEGRYEVSEMGQVRRAGGALLNQKVLRNGRCQVTLRRPMKTFYVHRLVAIAFLGIPEGRLEVCHGDSDPRNNRLTNLRWDTHAANMRDMAEQGRARNGNESKTSCPRGHEYDEVNTRWSSEGKRACRACHRQWQRDLRVKAREERESR